MLWTTLKISPKSDG